MKVKCYISAELSSKIWKTGSYIRNKWVKTQHKYDLVLQHIDEFWKIKLSDLKDMFPELTEDQCKKIFRNMKRNKVIELIKEWWPKNYHYIHGTIKSL